MREFLKLLAILLVFFAGSAITLSYTYTKTKPIIEERKQKKKLEAISEVLPPFDNDPVKEGIVIWDEKHGNVEFYIGKKGKVFTGVAFLGETTGYGGKVTMILGVTPDGKLHGIKIIDHNETIGLGSKITEPSFLRQFNGRGIDSAKWDVKKTGGDFDEISSATISSRAVIKGVREGLELFEKNKGRILTN
ncbi:MAG: RnfABCDGE type electron transport complex subunit G [Deltaproteobacteria bacterium]|nr:RnfABCDGE type electron transport complex subunit G [Deltaproteobacteria bacterium]